MSPERSERSKLGIERFSEVEFLEGARSAVGPDLVGRKGIVSAIGPGCPLYSDLTVWVQEGGERKEVVVSDEDVIPVLKDQKTSF